MRTPGRPLISSSCRSSVARRDGMLRQHGVEHRPDAELLGAVAFQRHLGDAAFDDLEAEPAVLDVLRRDDRAAQVKAGGAIEIADRGRRSRRGRPARPFSRDRADRRLRAVARDRHGADDGDVAQHEQRLGVRLAVRPGEGRPRQSGPRGLRLIGLLILEALFGLPRVKAGVRLLGARRQRGMNAVRKQQASHQSCGTRDAGAAARARSSTDGGTQNWAEPLAI